MASLTERQARVLAREKAKADAAAAAAAKRAARKKELKPIVDPPRGEDTTYFPNLKIKVPNSELNKPVSTMPVYNNRTSGGIAGAKTVNPVYNTY